MSTRFNTTYLGAQGVKRALPLTLLALVLSCGAARSAQQQQSQLRITGPDGETLVLSAHDLKNMPRTSVKVVNPHSKKTEVYGGVALAELLRRVGMPQGENLRGPAMAWYVVAEASDGYRVVFSAAELNSSIGNSGVIVADSLNGAPIGADEGPLKIVAPHDKRAARWVRMLHSLSIMKAPK
jgi:hypothetical protein